MVEDMVPGAYKDQFYLAKNTIYLDGNSLGLLAESAENKVLHTLQSEWKEDAIRSWNQSWYHLPERLAGKLAPIVGAKPNELLFCDNVSTNLFKLVAATLRHNPERKWIVTDDLNFPSDLYVMRGVIDLLGQHHAIEIVPSKDGIQIPTSFFEEALCGDTALLSLTHVSFKSGFMHDMKVITELAHRVGAFALWDLSHSTGAVPLRLNEWKVDMAVGCSYKYLNGGPGAPAFLYVREDLQESLSSPIRGWFGAKEPFAFHLDYTPAPGMKRFFSGTPPILPLNAIGANLDLINRAGMESIRKASLELSSHFIKRFQQELEPLDFKLATPIDPTCRGSHVSLQHKEAYAINRALIDPSDNGLSVIPDFRAPDNLRFGFAPLYNDIADIDQAIDRIVYLLSSGLIQAGTQRTGIVT